MPKTAPIGAVFARGRRRTTCPSMPRISTTIPRARSSASGLAITSSFAREPFRTQACHCSRTAFSSTPNRNRKRRRPLRRSMVSKSRSLEYVDDQGPGITRKKSGHGWAYFDPTGKRITDRAEIDRLNAVALPPAYTDAWFCPKDCGHLLATGIDARGRKQYRYNPEFRARQEAEKFDGCAEFGRLLPKIRRQVAKDLNQRTLSRERVVASVVRLLDLGAIRVGNESYAKSNNSFGATTLRMRHARVTGDTVRLRFKAKSGQLREASIGDAQLARLVRR